jgi:hypothetical protein
VGEEQHELQPYAQVVLKISSTNSEPVAKNNGLKLWRVLPVPASVICAFCNKFYAHKEELDEAKQRAAGCRELSSMVKQVAGRPLACKVNSNVFWFPDEAAQVVEILLRRGPRARREAAGADMHAAQRGPPALAEHDDGRARARPWNLSAHDEGPAHTGAQRAGGSNNQTCTSVQYKQHSWVSQTNLSDFCFVVFKSSAEL